MRIFKFLKNKLKTSRVATILLGVVIFSFFVFGFFKDTKSPSVLAESGAPASPDAIAVRIMPNLNHYSIARWYSDQKFKGSPQGLTVDGYEAIRDGRTVYVNAANVVGDILYTNIYLISYNQNAGGDTTSILDQLIAHWKFNTEKTTTGHCSKTTTAVCLIDADCPTGQYCDSEKARIIRDTKRLGELADMKTAIENYKINKTYYPKLSAGTYLANKTVSTWPSWQQTFAKDLGTNLPTDPINKLGACAGFDSTTCWKESTKTFAGTTLADGTLELPDSSNAFVYTAASNGSKYNVCAIMESGLVKTLAAGACPGSAQGHSTETTNNPPTITCGALLGTAGKEFRGYVGASDPDGDPLTWAINTGGTTWTNWSAAPVKNETANSNQKEIYALRAGDSGNYNFSITVDDGRTGGLVNKVCAIKIKPASAAPATCVPSSICNGVCPAGCTTATQDPDCGGAGCYGNGICEPATDCVAGPNDCAVEQCCDHNGTCDSGARETNASCPADCPPATNACNFNFNFPCAF